MSGWCCTADGTPLEATRNGLFCRSCETTYAFEGGVVRLDPAGRGSPQSIVELRAGVRYTSAEAAATELCERRGCRRIKKGADWKLLLPIDSNSRVLEIGPGFGDVTVDLASRAARVTVLAADVHAGAIVLALADLRGAANVEVAALAGLGRLPFGDASYDAVVCTEAGLRGFGVARRDLTPLADELCRVAAPGATVLVGQSNPLHRLPGIATLRERLSSRPEPTLDGLVHDALIRSPDRWGGTGLLRAMQAAGFPRPRVYAPIPDEERARAILPVADKAVVRYFLANLVRRNALLTRVALAALRPVVALGLFPHVVPYWFYVFDVPDRA